eukprot:5259013-Prymnesium_polylepis.1
MIARRRLRPAIAQIIDVSLPPKGLAPKETRIACRIACHIGTPGNRESPTGCSGGKCNHQPKRADNRLER